MAIFFIVPVAALLLRSVLEPVFGFGNYAELLGSATYLKIFANTFIVSGLVTAVSLVIGFPVAWALAIMPGRLASVIFAILLLSMWTNLLARTYAWMVLLQRTGRHQQDADGHGADQSSRCRSSTILTGVTIGMTYIMLPFIILPLYGVIKQDRPGNLAGGCPLRRQPVADVSRAFSCRWPCRAWSAGALMVFVMSLGYFVTPSLLGGTANMMLAELIAQFVQSLVNWGMGGAAALVLLVVTLSLYVVQLRLSSAPPEHRKGADMLLNFDRLGWMEIRA